MKNPFLTFILLFLLLSSCQQEKIPQVDQIPEDKMVDVLIQIHLLEAKIVNLNLKRDSSMLLYDSLESQLFSQKGITKKQFEQTLSMYYYDVNKIDAIYQIVVDSLSVRQQTKNIFP